MVRFLKYLALLLLVVFAADRILYSVIARLQKSIYTGIQGGKINDFLRQDPVPQLVIMGPSAPAYQLNPDFFTVNTYNLGHPDTEDGFQTGLLSVIVQHRRVPANILLYINPCAYTGGDSATDYESKSPLKLGFFYADNSLVTQYINDIGIKERVKFFLHLTRYNNRLFSMMKDYAGTKMHGAYKKGFFPFAASERDSITVTADYDREKALKKNSIDEHAVVRTNKMKYLKSFIQICRENNINIILFTLPGYTDVKDGVTNDAAKKNIAAFCAKNKLVYLDFRTGTLPSLINKATYWKDILHLNELGSPVESAFVAEQVNAYLVK